MRGDWGEVSERRTRKQSIAIIVITVSSFSGLLKLHPLYEIYLFLEISLFSLNPNSFNFIYLNLLYSALYVSYFYGCFLFSKIVIIQENEYPVYGKRYLLSIQLYPFSEYKGWNFLKSTTSSWDLYVYLVIQAGN